jgi:hypothetical protein
MTGGVTPSVDALRAYDDGRGGGPRLFAGGEFFFADGALALAIASWDGAAWSPLGPGLYGVPDALATYDDGSGIGPTLMIGGEITTTPSGDANLARYGGCAPAQPGRAFCFGDGGGTPCPCGNAGGPREGCANSSGSGASLAAGGTNGVLADDLWFQALGLAPGQPALLFAGTTALNGGDGDVFGDGLRCAGGVVWRLTARTASGTGAAWWGPGLGAIGGWTAGDVRSFQVWYRDPAGSPCASSFNLSSAYEVAFVP